MKNIWLVALSLLAFGVFADVADAQIITITPEVFQRVKGFAEKARSENPTSPTEAGYRFGELFRGEFGDTHPTVATIHQTPGLTIRALTPINMLATLFATAIRNMTPLPDKAEAAAVFVDVRPERMDAPDVKRIVLFLDGKEIPSIASNLAPTEFKNGLGVATTKGSGTVAWPVEVFHKGTVKMIFFTDGALIEWEYVPGKFGELK